MLSGSIPFNVPVQNTNRNGWSGWTRRHNPNSAPTIRGELQFRSARVCFSDLIDVSPQKTRGVKDLIFIERQNHSDCCGYTNKKAEQNPEELHGQPARKCGEGNHLSRSSESKEGFGSRLASKTLLTHDCNSFFRTELQKG